MDEDENLWRQFVVACNSYVEASNAIVKSPRCVSILQKALRTDFRYALRLVRILSQEQKRALFPEWVYLASFGHGAITTAREAILSLPRDWVLERIDIVAEPYLQQGTYDEYRRFLELYRDLDPDRMRTLAHRALQSADPDIREAGEDFLE
jgi:hypothetical protein